MGPLILSGGFSADLRLAVGFQSLDAVLVLARSLGTVSAATRRSKPPQPPPVLQSSQPQHRMTRKREAERMVGVMRTMRSRGEPIPEELTNRLKAHLESVSEQSFRDFDALSRRAPKVIVDLGALGPTTPLAGWLACTGDPLWDIKYFGGAQISC